MTGLLRLRITGSDPGGGYNEQADVLVNETADGCDLRVLWDEIQRLMAMINGERATITSLISHPTTVPADVVPQTLSPETFDVASEFGVPTGSALPPDYLKVGYTFRDYDKASRLTWKFLRDATAEQVRSVVTRIIEGGSQLVTGLILDRLFNPAEDYNEWQHSCFGLYNGTDGIKPPDFMGNTWTENTTHYLVSGADTLDSGDVENSISLCVRKGYGTRPGSQLIVLANPAESELIQGWKAGQPSRSGGPDAKWDFIKSSNAVPYLTQDNIRGAIPPADFNGVAVQGSYGKASLI